MMLYILIIFILSNSVFSEDFRDLSVSELLEIAEDINEIRPNDVSQTDVSYYLFTKNISNVKITNNIDNLIDETKNITILIHGWLESHRRSWYKKLTNELLKKDLNVIQVDWERVARSSYLSSAQNTKLIGEIIGYFVINQNISLEQIHFIGHSLGAHVAAFASQTLKRVIGKSVKRITALDPAGPYFKEFFITANDRLSFNDALIVDVIHTDGGFYGYEYPLGTLDIYVNGGKRIQPNCIEIIAPTIGEMIEKSFCSHSASIYFFMDMINKKEYTCIKCTSWEMFKNGECKDNEKLLISFDSINNDMKGTCFVTTDSPPNIGALIKSPVSIVGVKKLIDKVL